MLARHVAAAVDRLLARHGLRTSTTSTRWAVHPGGPRILDTVAEHLDLPADALDASRAGAGRARQLLVGDGPAGARRAAVGGPARAPGGYAVALAFGPGLTLYAALLRAR